MIRFPACTAVMALAVWFAPADVCRAEISYLPSLDAARKADAAKPVVLCFGATWCGWCRRLEADTLADPQVTKLAAGYHWVKVDIDEQKDLAARYRVRGVPAIVVLGANDAVLDRHDGYLPADRFATFLRNAIEPRPAGAKAIAERAPDIDLDAAALVRDLSRGDRERIESLVLQLARADRGHRRTILTALDEAGKAPWPWLWHLMQDERLATRAAAASALDHVTHAGLPFHPFASPDRRHAQSDAWKRWIEGRGVSIPAWDRTPPAVAEVPDGGADESPADAEIPR